jgi:uncharacterized iron-regulated membrane protein
LRKLNYKHYLRKAHRYLGVFVGIQFLLWTLGGLYFSWTDIHQVRGDHIRKPTKLALPRDAVSPAVALRNLAERTGAAEVISLSVVGVLDGTYYLIRYGEGARTDSILADVRDGSLRDSVTETEARSIAMSALAAPSVIAEVAYITKENVSGHHEFREKPLPAWAVRFEEGLTCYVSVNTGQLEAIRTDQWRLFDFLWMLHTMDFKGRDDINNYLLRGFSILGIVTVASGFFLFFASSRYFRSLFKGNRRGSVGTE